MYPRHNASLEQVMASRRESHIGPSLGTLSKSAGGVPSMLCLAPDFRQSESNRRRNKSWATYLCRDPCSNGDIYQRILLDEVDVWARHTIPGN